MKLYRLMKLSQSRCSNPVELLKRVKDRDLTFDNELFK